MIWYRIPPVLNFCLFNLIIASWNYHTSTLCTEVTRNYRQPKSDQLQGKVWYSNLPPNWTTRKLMKHTTCTAVCYCFIFVYSSLIGATAPDSDNHWLIFTLENTPCRSLFSSRLASFQPYPAVSVAAAFVKVVINTITWINWTEYIYSMHNKGTRVRERKGVILLISMCASTT